MEDHHTSRNSEKSLGILQVKETMASVAALDFGTFSPLNAQEAIPEAWDERARKGSPGAAAVDALLHVAETQRQFHQFSGSCQ